MAPTLTVTLSDLDFMRLGCGRVAAAQVDAAGGVGVAGDAVVAKAVVNSMNLMF